MKKAKLSELKEKIQEATAKRVMAVINKYPNGIPAEVVEDFKIVAQAQVRREENL